MAAYTGEFAALATAVCWTVTAMAFEEAGKRIGSLQVNIIRLFIAVVFLSAITWIFRGKPFPDDATAHQWIWLALSGIFGFLMGDLLLFKAFVLIGARLSMLIMATVPIISTLISFFLLGEQLDLQSYIAMAITLSGISMVILVKKKGEKMKFSVPALGLLIAFGGAAGQAIGIVLSKYGMQDYNPFAATQIRIYAGVVGFVALFTVLGRWKKVSVSFSDRHGLL